MSNIPNVDRWVSPASAHNGPSRPASLSGGFGPLSANLPLYMVGHIITYLQDSPADLARLTRTSRLLHYMATPALWTSVTLRARAEIRAGGLSRSEGFGGGSPFVMALEALVARDLQPALVNEFKASGEWREVGAEEFARGRVPDNSMMLNILLRVAVDKMSNLQIFTWELNCKPFKTLYQGFANRQLTALSIRFPSKREARPVILIPPIPHLRAFKMSNYDPMCYPDDISLLIMGSPKLRDLRLHFSPRMRREAEHTLNLQTFFGRCMSAGMKLKLKHFAMQNFFGEHGNMIQVFDPDTLESNTFLDNFGGMLSSPRNVFGDSAWQTTPQDALAKHRYKTWRMNDIVPEFGEVIRRTKPGLQRVYFVSARVTCPDDSPGSYSDQEITPTGASPDNPEDAPSPEQLATVGRDIVHALTRTHGATLTHLLLSDLWPLSQTDISDIVRHCPNLEQLGIALDESSSQAIPLLLPFLPKLTAFRVLHNATLEPIIRNSTPASRLELMTKDINRNKSNLRWVALGNESLYEILLEQDPKATHGGASLQQRPLYRVTEAEKGAADHVDIWRLDSMDISLDKGCWPTITPAYGRAKISSSWRS